jgi:hypothetical protein
MTKKRRPGARQTIDKFRGRAVVGVSAKVSNVGDGLSQAWELTGEDVPLLVHGDRVTVVVEAVVVDIDTQPANKKDLAGDLVYVYNFRGETVALGDNASNRKLLDRQRAVISKANEMPGQTSINDELPPDEGDASGS